MMSKLFHLVVGILSVLLLTSSSSCLLVRGNDDMDDSIATTSSATTTTTTMCPVVTSTNTAVTMDDTDGFDEISGLAVSLTQKSRKGNPIFFACNDSGDGPRLGLFDSATAEHLLTVRLDIAAATDWEDMTLGPCTVKNNNNNNDGGDDEAFTNSCIYIADTGDNEARFSGGARSGRNNGAPYRILQIREPVWTEHDDDAVIDVLAVLVFDYRNTETFLSSMGVFADSEALFVDTAGWGDGATPGDLYVVPKWDENLARYYTRVFYIPVSAWDEAAGNGAVYSPKAINSAPRAGEASSLLGPMWTSANMSPDGTLIALGAYEGTYLFLRCPGASVASALTQPHCLFWPNPTPGTQVRARTRETTDSGCSIFAVLALLKVRFCDAQTHLLNFSFMPFRHLPDRDYSVDAGWFADVADPGR